MSICIFSDHMIMLRQQFHYNTGADPGWALGAEAPHSYLGFT